jgi:subtilisin family serine protease
VIPAATAQEAPPLHVEPTLVAPSGTIAVSGTGFGGDCAVSFHLDDPAASSLGSATPQADGGFAAELVIPASTEPGSHTLFAVGLEFRGEFCSGPSGKTASAEFEVIPERYDYVIPLHARLLDDPGIDPEFLDELIVAGDPRHGIVQLHALPRSGDIEELAGVGIEPLAYLNGLSAPGTAYLARLVPPLDASSPSFERLVRGLQPLEPEGKKSLLLPSTADPSTVLALFFPEVPQSAARALLAGLGIDGRARADGLWEVEASSAQIDALAAADEVQWLEPPTPYLPTLTVTRQLANVDQVQQLNAATGVYAGLSGSGVQIAIMDTGVDTSHNDFASRMIRSLDDGFDHGTHVAGIAAGSGAMSDQLNGLGFSNGIIPFLWRGVAPRAQIAAYPQSGSNIPDYFDAITNFGVDVSNHSYIQTVQGLYTSDPQIVDRMIRGGFPTIPRRPLIWAAANNASVGPRDCDGDSAADGNFPQYPFPGVPPGGPCPTAFQAGYFSMLSTCKNCIIVGSVDDNQVHTAFSSMGPTLDGRLKPDVMASGSDVTSVRSDRDGTGNPDFTNGYKTLNGTSMASPAVAGMVALMLEQYAATFGGNLDASPPLPSTSRAILVQTAEDLAGTDLNPNFDTGVATAYGAGPDWATGYGLADALGATQMVAARNFLEDSLDDVGDHTDVWFVPVAPGQTEVRVTLAWDDIEGTPNANVTAPMLVNDLDLELVDPNGVVHRPQVLPIPTPRDCDANAANGVQVGTCIGQDPGGQNFFGPSAEGIDRRNNLEQVVVTGSLPVGNWRVRVSVRNPDGTLRLPLGGTQTYSLAGVTTNQPPTADAGGPYATVEGTDVTLAGSGTDPELGSLTFDWDFDGDGFDDATGPNPTFDRVGQDGSFVVRLRVTEPGGLIAVDSATVNVSNIAPAIDTLATDSPRPEGSPLALDVVAHDPGWLETLNATVDWGDGSPVAPLAGAGENVRPDATFTAAAAHAYGDNGTFTLQVCVSDDDTTTCSSTPVTVTNVSPSVTLDTSSAVPFPGGDAFLGKAGIAQDHQAGATDPGSDDLTFAWSFGETTIYFNNGVGPDPFPSPLGVFPFAASDTGTVAFALPGAYAIGVTVTDDDGASDPDSAAKVVVGAEEDTHPSGWWKHQYRGTGIEKVVPALLAGYLDVIELASSVFSEQTALTGVTDAVAVFEAPNSDRRAAATADLLVAWLHFASGAAGWTDPVPTGGGATRPYHEVIAEIETVILDPAASDVDLLRASQLAQRTFLSG